MSMPGSPATRRLGWTLILLASSTVWARADIHIQVGPVEPGAAVVPLSVPVPDSLIPGPARLVPLDDQSRSIEAFVFSDENDQLTLSAVLTDLPTDRPRTYRFEPGPTQVTGPRISIKPRDSDDSGDVDILLDGQLFTTLVRSEPTKPYFDPLIGPTGEPLTRAYPMREVEGEDRDHNHQRSFWITHGDVNGTDFWASDPLNKPSPRHGKIQVEKVRVINGEPNGALSRLVLNDAWKSSEGKTLCTDERIFTFYAINSPRMIDVDVTIKAGDEPVTFGDTKEGMFGLRVASSMNVNRRNGGRVTNAEGITDTDAWGKRSGWVDYSGPVAGQQVGIAILNHPQSFRFPTAWHVRDYGLFAANPFGYEDFGIEGEGSHTLAPGETMVFRYRVILHEGGVEQAAILPAFESYSRPLKVSVQAD